MSRACDRCGCLLAADHLNIQCSPCAAVLRRSAAGAGGPSVGLRALTATWGGGFPGFQRASGLDAAGAADLAVRLGLLPRRWRLDAAGLALLTESTRVPTTSLAARLGVSRWTVSGWRHALGLDRPSPGRARGPAAVVCGVEVVVGNRRGPTRLLTADGPVRLGRVSRSVVEALAAAHPGQAPDEVLLAQAYRGVEVRAARDALHQAVSRLRAHLPPGAIAREPGGYRLAVPASAVHG